MDNNKTIILDEDLPPPLQKANSAFIQPEDNFLSSLSSNKTIILSDNLPNEENRGHIHKNQDTRSQIKEDKSKDKSFFHFFDFNHPNELLGFATPVLSFVNRMRALKEYDNSLFQTAIELINEYIIKLKNAEIKTEILQSASYILCMTIDEVALKCPWSYASPWIKSGILDTFFQQSQDDGYFLSLIEYYLTNQSKNKNILEVFAVCLSMCTRGNPSSKTAVKADNLRHKMLHALKNQGSFQSNHFSPHAVPADQIKRQIPHAVPLWIIAVVSVCLLVIIYISFKIALSLTSEPVYNRIIQLYQPGQITPTQEGIQ